jgi:hypothetical protein
LIANDSSVCSGTSVTLSVSIDPSYPIGTVKCQGTLTKVKDVINPTTGKIWMDRNLGASRVAISSTDSQSYGDLYQWGRRSDGHQCRNSSTTNILSSVDQPEHSDFISSLTNWQNTPNYNLWQGVNGVNNPCPEGYRVPTSTELTNERLSWSSNNPAGAFASPLKLPMAGYRDHNNGDMLVVGNSGYYTSNTASSSFNSYLRFTSGAADISPARLASGLSVRCIKN